SKPELDESGDEAFRVLRQLTEPDRKKAPFSPGIGCGSTLGPGRNLVGPHQVVQVLEEKRVAGFNAVVLEANSASALSDWLKNNGYAFSPEVEAWAKPYVEAGWKITALKVARDRDSQEKRVAAAALRMSFKTDRPLFPYREPDSGKTAKALDA